MPPWYRLRKGKSSHVGGFGVGLTMSPAASAARSAQLARVKRKMNMIKAEAIAIVKYRVKRRRGKAYEKATPPFRPAVADDARRSIGVCASDV